jgi:Bacterial Ig-like domain
MSLFNGTLLTGTETAQGVALAPGNAVIVVGYTSSTNFPVSSAIQSSFGSGTQDAFLTELNSAGSGVIQSTYFGGTGSTSAAAVASDYQGDAFFTGSTTNIVTVNPAQVYGGSGDAFVAEISQATPVPAITAISPDTGSSSSDQVTDNQNLTISGTGTTGATITVYRTDLGSALGTATVSSGTWSYNYSGTTLPQGSYAFQATATVSGVTSTYSAPFHVTVDLTAPTVSLQIDSSTYSLAPQMHVSAWDAVGLPASTTVTLDVDLLDDGLFTDPGDANYTSATLVNGSATFALSPALAAGSYHVRAHLADLAGNIGYSASQAFTVNALATSSLSGPPTGPDPINGNALDFQGTLTVSQLLDLDQSPGTAVSNNTALVYNSDRVNPEPILYGQVQTQNNVALPSTITIQLTWNGTAQTAQTYSTTGLAAGELFTFSQQVSSAVSTTGLYNYSLQAVLNYGTPVTLTYSGSTAVTAETSSAYGAGWTLSTVDKLYSVTGGILRELGSGGWDYYASTGTYTYSSPAWDTGTLTGLVGGGYQYVLPDGATWKFNSSGVRISIVEFPISRFRDCL